MSEYSDIIKQGYVKTRSKNLGHWQKRWFILRKASSKGPNRIERFSDEKSSMLQYECRVIDLTNVERVERIRFEKLHVLVLSNTNGEVNKFAANSDMDASDWLELILENIGKSKQISSGAGLETLANRDIFHVYLLPSSNLEYYGEYLLQVTSESIILREAMNTFEPLVTWKLNTLRKYGRDPSKFTFESGRSSQTGEGLFIFTTVDSELIYEKVHSATQALVTVHSMVRRQKESLVPERSVFPVIRPVVRHNSETGVLSSLSNGEGPELPYRDSKSLPATPKRGPLPPPRLNGAAHVTDNNANSKFLYCETDEFRPPQVFSAQLPSRPLPPPPPPHSASTENASEPDYIYEEKGLSDNFRQFLRERKEDDLL